MGETKANRPLVEYVFIENDILVYILIVDPTVGLKNGEPAVLLNQTHQTVDSQNC